MEEGKPKNETLKQEKGYSQDEKERSTKEKKKGSLKKKRKEHWEKKKETLRNTNGNSEKRRK